MIGGFRHGVSYGVTTAGKIGRKCVVTGGTVHLSMQQARGVLCRVIRPVASWLGPTTMWQILGILFLVFGLLNLVAFHWLGKLGRRQKRTRRGNLRLDAGKLATVVMAKVTRQGTVYG